MNHKTELRDAEAARLAVPPRHPGDDPPTHGDEGGGNLYPEPSRTEPRRKSLLRRLLDRWRRS